MIPVVSRALPSCSGRLARFVLSSVIGRLQVGHSLHFSTSDRGVRLVRLREQWVGMQQIEHFQVRRFASRAVQVTRYSELTQSINTFAFALYFRLTSKVVTSFFPPTVSLRLYPWHIRGQKGIPVLRLQKR